MRSLLCVLVLLVCPASVSAATVTIDGKSLQATIATAHCGDTINLYATDTTVLTPHNLPAVLSGERCSGPAYTVIQTASCPSNGAFANRDTTGMATFVTGGPDVFDIEKGARFWKIDCVAMRGVVGTAQIYNFIQIGSGSADQDTLDEIPSDIVLDRLVCTSGDDVVNRRCIFNNGARVTIDRLWCENVKDTADAQCVGMINTFGPMLLDRSYLEATGENVILGGGQAYVPGAVPTNVIIRRSVLTKRLSWFDPATKHPEWTLKNLLEVKAGDTVTVEDSTLSNSGVDGQIGQAFVLTPRGWAAPNAWTYARHILIQRVHVSNVCRGFQIIGETDHEGGDVTLVDASSDFVVQDSFFHINARTGMCANSDSKFMASTLSPDAIKALRNTIIIDQDSYAVDINGNAPSGPPRGFEFGDNVMQMGHAAFIGQGSTGTLGLNNAYGSTWTWAGNCIGADDASGYPAGNIYQKMSAWLALFENYAGGDFRLKPGGVCAGKGADFSKLPPTFASQPIELPPVEPPPTPNVCMVTPLKVTGIKWPNGQTGNKSGTWNSGTFTLTTAGFKWSPLRFEGTDSRGCSVTVTK